MQENFISLLDTKSRELLHQLTQVPKDDIRNVKNERGAFPQRIVETTLDNGLKQQKKTPYGPGDVFIAFALEDNDPSIVASERIGNVTYAQYNFAVVFVIYGSKSSFVANRMLLNMFDPQTLSWVQQNNLAFSEMKPKVETQDTVINNEWWIIRKCVLNLNCDIVVNTITQEILLDDITIGNVQTLNNPEVLE